jgi:hypothetical protein
MNSNFKEPGTGWLCYAHQKSNAKAKGFKCEAGKSEPSQVPIARRQKWFPKTAESIKLTNAQHTQVEIQPVLIFHQS